MTKKIIVALILCLVFGGGIIYWKSLKTSSAETSHHDEHEKEHEEGEHEESASVGEDKGITKADEKNGFSLSKEAYKNFNLKTQKLEGSAPWSIPSSARMLSQEEVNLYRLRDGFIKRVDFDLEQSSGDKMLISSSELKAGDEIFITNIGLVRISELAAFGGAEEGHSH